MINQINDLPPQALFIRELANVALSKFGRPWQGETLGERPLQPSSNQFDILALGALPRLGPTRRSLCVRGDDIGVG
jgi:hypothetical protein